MKLKCLLKRLYSVARCFYQNFPQGCIIERKVKILNSVLHGKNKVLFGTCLEQCDLGYGSFIGRNTHLNKTKIGRYCSIGEEVRLVYGTHPTRNFISTHPAFYSKKGQYGFTYVDKNMINEIKYYNEGELLEIGNDVWIGSYARIMSGIKIGDGAVVGAGALVTKNVLPYSVVAGVPAKEIYKRFTDEQIKKLLEIEWWNKSEEWIEDNIELFCDVDKFINGANQ